MVVQLMGRVGLVAVALTACSTPVPTLEITWAGTGDAADTGLGGLSQRCTSSVCDEVPLKCASVISIRILDPSTSEVFLEQCEELLPNGRQDMCAVGGIDLKPVALPVAKLEVQVAIFPPSATTQLEGGARSCPVVQYTAATGFPVAASPAPALGGRAFYHPGDATISVRLGCTDLDALNQSCVAALMSVDATIEDFQTRMPLTGQNPAPDQLDVAIGEPRGAADRFVLTTTDLQSLIYDGTLAGWHNDAVSLTFNRYACIAVLENVAQSTSTVTCTPTSSPIAQLSAHGIYLSRDRLETVTKALRIPAVPSTGLTIGMVVDAFGDATPGKMVSADLDGKAYPVQYLADDGSIVESATESSGIFVSTTAPFGTSFDTKTNPGEVSLHGTGGLVANRVTMVILRPSSASGVAGASGEAVAP